MKTTLVLLIFGFTSMAAACPQLAGEWTCKDSDGTTNEGTIKQVSSAQGTVYTFASANGRSSVYNANGETQAINENGTVGTLLASCRDDQALLATEHLKNSGMAFSADVVIVDALQDTNTLNLVTTATITDAGQAPQTSTATASCTRR